GCVEPSVQT
ncbi:sensory box protein, partial [Vibrio parahaemolyticus AQ3810]